MERIKYLNRMLVTLSVTLLLLGCGDTSETTPVENKVEKSQVAKTDTFTESLQIEGLGEALKEAQSQIAANPDMKNEEKSQIITESLAMSKGMQSKFEQAQKTMPKILEAMKFGKKCLTKADSKAEAKVCMDKTDAMFKESGMDEEDMEDEDFNWTPADKKEMLAEIDEGIKEMESNLPCIEKSKNMMDMMNCSQ